MRCFEHTFAETDSIFAVYEIGSKVDTAVLNQDYTRLGDLLILGNFITDP